MSEPPGRGRGRGRAAARVAAPDPTSAHVHPRAKPLLVHPRLSRRPADDGVGAIVDATGTRKAPLQTAPRDLCVMVSGS